MTFAQPTELWKQSLEFHRNLRETSETNRCEEINGESRVPRIVTWEQTLKERLQRPEKEKN